MNSCETDNNVRFHESYCADITLIPGVINRLIDDMNSINFPEEEMMEIVISMDESLTDVFQKVNEFRGRGNAASIDTEEREVTVRYMLTDRLFEAFIVDHSGSADIFNRISGREAGIAGSGMLFDLKSVKNCDVRVLVNGQPQECRFVGPGFKILSNFMDRIVLEFTGRGRQSKMQADADEKIEGTALKITRKRRY